MHSRIYELSDRPVPEDGRYSLSDVPEWFFSTIADYGDDIASGAREGEIRWLAESFHGLCVRDGDRLLFDPGTREKYFRPRYSQFLEHAGKLTGFPPEAFSGGEGNGELEYALFAVSDAYEDRYGFYVFDPASGELQTLHAWLRSADLTKPYYVGGIVDYHF